MIELTSSGPTLARFVRELDAQAPRRVDPRRVGLEGASPADVEAAWLGWASRIVDEHRSVVVFTELLGLLAAAAAPYEALCAVQRLIGDELRHVRLCAEMAAAFGPLEELDVDLQGLGLPPRSEPELARAIAIVARELVVAEGESILALRAYRDAATDPGCRDALALLLADEARHHATGRHLLERLLAWAPPDVIDLAELERTMCRDALEIRDAHRRGARGGPGRRYGVSIRPSELAIEARSA